MCLICNAEGKRRRDPTGMTWEIELFLRETRRRFRKLNKEIQEGLILHFGNSFDFRSNPDKIQEFLEWLNKQEEAGILEVTTGPRRLTSSMGSVSIQNAPWSNLYIMSAYRKGLFHGYKELVKAGALPRTATDSALIEQAFFRPVHADAAAILYQRAFTDLKGIDQFMDTKISQTLSQAIIEGKNPRVVGKELAKIVDLGRKRAETMARTEMVRAHNIANVNVYEEAGVEDVTVLAEWMTAGYNVCPDCAALQGKVFKLDTIRQLIPLHPNCRCVALPHIEEVHGKPKEKSPFAIAPKQRSTVAAQYRDKKGRIRLRGIMKKKLESANITVDNPKGVF